MARGQNTLVMTSAKSTAIYAKENCIAVDASTVTAESAGGNTICSIKANIEIKNNSDATAMNKSTTSLAIYATTTLTVDKSKITAVGGTGLVSKESTTITNSWVKATTLQ